MASGHRLLSIQIRQRKNLVQRSKSLVQLGADVNNLCPQTNKISLAYTFNEKNHRVVKDLLQFEADVDMMPSYHTALKMAILNTHHHGTKNGTAIAFLRGKSLGDERSSGPCQPQC